MKKEAKILAAIFLILVGLFALGSFLYTDSGSQPQASDDQVATSEPPGASTMGFTGLTPSQKGVLVRPDSPALGPENAKVTVVEFLDPECESCQAMYPYVKDILSRFEGQVRFVVRYMPYHTNSHLAARANEAAGLQDKYWEMQELLFERQGEWGHQQEPQTQKFIGYAKELGLDTEKFKADMESEELKQKINRDQEDATTVGIRGTPSFYVNQKPLVELHPDNLERMIETELNN